MMRIFCFEQYAVLSFKHETESHKTPETPETPFRYHFGSGMGMYLVVNKEDGVALWLNFLLKTVSEHLSRDCDLVAVGLFETKNG